MRNGSNPVELMLLLALNRKLDRLLAGQRREEQHDMRTEDALALIGGKVDTLSTDDAAAFALLQGKIDAGDVLTPDEEAQVTALAAKLDADDAADQAILNPSGTAGTPGALDGSPVEDGGAVADPTATGSVSPAE